MSGEVLENSMSSHGMRWLHVVQMGQPVNMDTWLSQINHYCLALVETQTEYEQDLDMHHLRLWWPAREVITAQGGPDWLNGRKALLWKIAKGQVLREAVMFAGIAYLDLVGRWPKVALVQKIPEMATERVLVYADSEERVEVKLEAIPTLPRGFVLMAERIDKLSAREESEET